MLQDLFLWDLNEADPMQLTATGAAFGAEWLGTQALWTRLMADIVNPIGVELDETARRMRIRWDDGHLGEWSWLALRRACPCALCAGEGNLPGVVTLETFFDEQQTHMNELRWIGRYALAPIWADGHDTGLFTYTKLRQSCECAEHAAAV